MDEMSGHTSHVANGTQVSTSKIARWALLSGTAGVIANVLLILFYVMARPWQETGGSAGWLGRANDSFVALQFAALLPVINGIRALMPADPKVRAWTKIGLAASGAVVVLELLLIFRILPFAIQVTPVTLCIIATFCWASGLSRAAQDAQVLPLAVTRFGRALGLGLALGAAVFLLGFAISWAAALSSGAWIVGALPGFLVFLAFPVWVLLLARTLLQPLAGSPESGR